MERWKRGTLAILTLLLFYVSATPVANAVNAVVVSDVKDLYYYTPGDNSFTRGSTLKVYTDMSNVNYDGFVFVDFVFIIKDPRGHVVSMDRMDVIRRDYNDAVYVVYTKNIPSWWLYGKYDLDVFAYNRLDKMRIDELERKVETSSPGELIDTDEFEDLEEFFEDAFGGDEDDLEDLGVIKSFSDSTMEIEYLSFFVRREEEIKPAEPPEAEIEESIFTVTDVELDKFTVKPGETFSISVTVKNEGIRGTKKVTLVINGETEAEETVTLGSMESKTVIFYVKKDLPGTYKVTIPGTDIVKLFFVEESSEEGAAFAPATPQSEEGSGGEKGLPIYLFGIAFILLLPYFVVVIIPRRFRSKRP